jgi:hypothetical protein
VHVGKYDMHTKLEKKRLIGKCLEVSCKDLSKIQLAHDKGPVQSIMVMAVNPHVT